MSERTVVPFPPRPRPVPIRCRPEHSSTLVWPVADLPDERQCAEWLDQAIVGASYENTARSLWRHHPNLRISTEKLASYITPLWPAAGGGPLLQVAVERAIGRAQQAIDQGQAFEGRLVGVYLYGLLDVVGDIARLVVRGEDWQGRVLRWEYFEQPLQAWARQHGIDYLIPECTHAPPSDVVLSGLRTHMTAALADPVDAGYLARHPAQG
jgi:hypothetical protein